MTVDRNDENAGSAEDAEPTEAASVPDSGEEGGTPGEPDTDRAATEPEAADGGPDDVTEIDQSDEQAPGAEGDGESDEVPDAEDPHAPEPAATGPVNTTARRRRRMNRVRAAAGAALSLVAAAAVVGATSVEWPTFGGESASIVVSPNAAPAVASCNGPLLAVGRDATAADEIAVAQQVGATVGTSGEGEPTVEDLAADGVSGDADAQRYELEPTGGEAESLSVATSTEIRADDMSGFMAASCRTAAMESWIVGGSTAVGDTDVLLIANPGGVNATVQLTVFGTQGEAQPAGEPIAIPAMSQVVLPLAGIAGGEEGPVVRVTAEGAPVRAALQSTRVSTLDPVGVDAQDAVTAGESQVFPGVAIAEDAVDADETPASVRLLAREDGEATVTITAQGESRPSSTLSLEVQADVPVQAALDDLEPGRYTVTVSGDVGPLVSAVWQTTGPNGDEDFAWQTPSPAVSDPVTVAVPDGPLARAYLVGDADEATTVTIVGGEVDEEIRLAAGDSAYVTLDADEAYTLASDGGPVHAVVAYRDGGSLAALPVWPDPAAMDDVTVFP